MGEVFLARVEGTGGFEKLCVIKKILPQYASDSVFVERFIHEARTLVKLSHGSIAQVFDMGLHEGAPYLALEYVDGKDLRKVIAKGKERDLPLPLTFCLFVMIRVLDALAYAHRKRDDEDREIALVHRDVSPQNVLVSYEGEVKVIDFGLAKSTLSAASTHPSIILGKFLYMSPEQARQQRVDRRSDLYSVGLCLYELIGGANPFEAAQSGDLVGAVADPKIPPLSEVVPLCPPQVSSIVAKALAVDPAHRFQSAEEFRGRLQSLLHEIDPTVGPESVSRFMRESFAVEYSGERKLISSVRQWVSSAKKSGMLRARDVDTAVFALREGAKGTQVPAPLPVQTPLATPVQDDGPTQGRAVSPLPRRTDTKPEVELGKGPTRTTLVLEPGALGPAVDPGSDPMTFAAVPSLLTDVDFPWEGAGTGANGLPLLSPPPPHLGLGADKAPKLSPSMSETQPGFRLAETDNGDTEPRVLLGTLVEAPNDETDADKTLATVVVTGAHPLRTPRVWAAIGGGALVVTLLALMFASPRWTRWMERLRASPPKSQPLQKPSVPTTTVPASPPRPAPTPGRDPFEAEDAPELLAPLRDPARSPPPAPLAPKAKGNKGR